VRFVPERALRYAKNLSALSSTPPDVSVRLNSGFTRAVLNAQFVSQEFLTATGDRTLPVKSISVSAPLWYAPAGFVNVAFKTSNVVVFAGIYLFVGEPFTIPFVPPPDVSSQLLFVFPYPLNAKFLTIEPVIEKSQIEPCHSNPPSLAPISK